jgi:hypothetical protein
MIAWDLVRRCVIATAILSAALLGHQVMVDEVAESAAHLPATVGH